MQFDAEAYSKHYIVQALFNVTDNKLEQVSYSLGSEA